MPIHRRSSPPSVQRNTLQRKTVSFGVLNSFQVKRIIFSVLGSVCHLSSKEEPCRRRPSPSSSRFLTSRCPGFKYATSKSWRKADTRRFRGSATLLRMATISSVCREGSSSHKRRGLAPVRPRRCSKARRSRPRSFGGLCSFPRYDWVAVPACGYFRGSRSHRSLIRLAC